MGFRTVCPGPDLEPESKEFTGYNATLTKKVPASAVFAETTAEAHLAGAGLWWNSMGVFDSARRGPRTGGEVVRSHIAQAAGGTDAYVFSYRHLEVHAYVLAEPVPHVLYCTYGKSRVESSQPSAGTQTELTLRMPGTPALPDEWPAKLLARAARDDIEPGHCLVLDNPRGTLAGFAFVTDPVLGTLDGPTGRIRFTYAVGLNGDDVEYMLSWDPLKFAAFVGDRVPLGLSSTDRDPIAADPQVRALLEEAVGAEGSSIGAMHARYLEVDAGGRVDLDPAAARAIIRAARHRILHGRTFALLNGDIWFLLDPQLSAAELTDDHIAVLATTALARELLAVFDAVPGLYRLRTAPLEIRVVDPTT